MTLRHELLQNMPPDWFAFMHKDCPRAPDVFFWHRSWWPDLYDWLTMIKVDGKEII